MENPFCEVLSLGGDIGPHPVVSNQMLPVQAALVESGETSSILLGRVCGVSASK